MPFLLIKKLCFNNLKTRIVVCSKISVFVIRVEAILYLLLYNLHGFTFKVMEFPKWIWEICWMKTVVSVKSDICSLHNNIKVNRPCSSTWYSRFSCSSWNNNYWKFFTSNRTVIDQNEIFSYTNITEKNRFAWNEKFNRFTAGLTNSFTNNTATVLLILIVARKTTGLITAYNTSRFTESFSTNTYTQRNNIVTTMCFK